MYSQEVPKEIEAYIQTVDPDRQEAIRLLRTSLIFGLPDGFEEGILYDMPAFFVPFDRYPKGYHASKNTPLPFINYAAQKSHIALYHMGMYNMNKLHEWFTSEYAAHAPTKLNMGKSCIRWKKPHHIPYPLITQLAAKVDPDEWIAFYEQSVKK